MSTIEPSPRERARRGAGKRTTWVAVGIVAVALILPFTAPILRPIGAVIGTPLYAVSDYVKDAFLPVTDYFSSKSLLAEENRQLRENVAKLSAASIELDALSRERDELLKIVNFNKKHKNAVVAKVIARSPATAFDTLLINQGEDDGIEDGALAYSGSVPIGIVTRLSDDSSVVTLLSAAGASLSVSISGKAIEAIGRGGGRFEVALPSHFTPATGTPVTTLEGSPLATVAMVISGESEGSIEALLVSPVDIATVRYLTIIK